MAWLLVPTATLYVSSSGTDSVLRYDGTTGDFIDDFVESGSGGLNGPEDCYSIRKVCST